jgi:hypothetical protein
MRQRILMLAAIAVVALTSRGMRATQGAETDYLKILGPTPCDEIRVSVGEASDGSPDVKMYRRFVPDTSRLRVLAREVGASLALAYRRNSCSAAV